MRRLVAIVDGEHPRTKTAAPVTQRIISNPITYAFMGDRPLSIPDDPAVLREALRRRAHSATLIGRMDEQVIRDMAIMWELLDQIAGKSPKMKAHKKKPRPAEPTQRRRLHEVPTWLQVLRAVNDLGGALQGEVRRATGLGASTVSGRLTDMSRRGWVERVENADTPGAPAVWRITEDGKAQLDAR